MVGNSQGFAFFFFCACFSFGLCLFSDLSSHRKMPPTKNISSHWERDSIERLLRPSKLNYSKKLVNAFYSMKEVWKSNFHDNMDR